MSRTKPNRDFSPKGLEKNLELFKQGVATALPAGTTITVGGVTYGAADLEAKCADYLKPFADARDAEVAADQKRRSRNSLKPELRRFLADAKNAVRGTLGKGNPELSKFGMKPTAAEPHRKAKKDDASLAPPVSTTPSS